MPGPGVHGIVKTRLKDRCIAALHAAGPSTAANGTCSYQAYALVNPRGEPGRSALPARSIATEASCT